MDLLFSGWVDEKTARSDTIAEGEKTNPKTSQSKQMNVCFQHVSVRVSVHSLNDHLWEFQIKLAHIDG